MEKRYQVFISSTFSDLQEERRAIMQTLMEMECIPAGMELFPAADEDQLLFIQKIIDDCDYYLLLIGGRYGSLTSEGISYTEKEYDYAVQIGLKVIALIHKNPEEISLAKSESEPRLRDSLNAFRAKVSTGRLVKFWNTTEELAGLVSLSVQRAIRNYPAVGWIRGDTAASTDLLSQINQLRQENEKLREQLGRPLTRVHRISVPIENIDNTFNVHVYTDSHRSGSENWTLEISWKDIFSFISPYLLKKPIDSEVKEIIQKAIVSRARKVGFLHRLNDQDFQTISIQMMAFDLVDIGTDGQTTPHLVRWSLTELGEKLMYELRTIRV